MSPCALGLKTEWRLPPLREKKIKSRPGVWTSKLFCPTRELREDIKSNCNAEFFVAELSCPIAQKSHRLSFPETEVWAPFAIAGSSNRA